MFGPGRARPRAGGADGAKPGAQRLPAGRGQPERPRQCGIMMGHHGRAENPAPSHGRLRGVRQHRDGHGPAVVGHRAGACARRKTS
jgi:hypothetical protein